MSASTPSLASLVAAVRAHAPIAGWSAPMGDADIAEVVRTARTAKGAIWLATRAAGPQEDASKQDGQAATAEACLRKLAAAGHAGAAAALAAWSTVALREEMALADALAAELADQTV